MASSVPFPHLAAAGISIPQIGLGTYRSEKGDETRNSVLWALERGYRHIDTAAIYGNEADVGQALRDSGVPREELFVTTKLWPAGKNYDGTIAACRESLRLLGLDYVDLYLIHGPLEPHHRLEQWRALEDLREQGLVRSIGVSNYGVHHLQELLQHCRVKPVVNQIEITPYLTRTELVTFCKQNGILLEAYSPLTKGQKLSDPKLVRLAQKYDKSTAQILLRWALQKGYVILPKSVKRERIHENADIDFAITDEDMVLLDSFNEDLVTGWDPTVQA